MSEDSIDTSVPAPLAEPATLRQDAEADVRDARVAHRPRPSL